MKLQKENYKDLKEEIAESGNKYYGKEPNEVINPTRPKESNKNKIALILCCGIKHFWEETPRQFWPIGKETILDRLIRQVKSSGIMPVVVTNRQDICERMIKQNIAIYNPEHCRTIAETWLFTVDLWREQTIVLLGDTIYPNDVIKDILEDDPYMQMYGNSAEIFSCSFDEGYHQTLMNTLFETNRDTWKAATWEIYRHWCGFPYDSGKKETKFLKIIPNTADIDAPYQYEDVIKGKAYE